MQEIRSSSRREIRQLRRDTCTKHAMRARSILAQWEILREKASDTRFELRRRYRVEGTRVDPSRELWNTRQQQKWQISAVQERSRLPRDRSPLLVTRRKNNGVLWSSKCFPRSNIIVELICSKVKILSLREHEVTSRVSMILLK